MAEQQEDQPTSSKRARIDGKVEYETTSRAMDRFFAAIRAGMPDKSQNQQNNSLPQPLVNLMPQMQQSVPPPALIKDFASEYVHRMLRLPFRAPEEDKLTSIIRGLQSRAEPVWQFGASESKSLSSKKDMIDRANLALLARTANQIIEDRLVLTEQLDECFEKQMQLRNQMTTADKLVERLLEEIKHLETEQGTLTLGAIQKIGKADYNPSDLNMNRRAISELQKAIKDNIDKRATYQNAEAELITTIVKLNHELVEKGKNLPGGNLTESAIALANSETQAHRSQTVISTSTSSSTVTNQNGQQLLIRKKVQTAAEYRSAMELKKQRSSEEPASSVTPVSKVIGQLSAYSRMILQGASSEQHINAPDSILNQSAPNAADTEANDSALSDNEPEE